MSNPQEIVRRYRSQGYRGAKLRRMVERHSNILSANDPGMAEALLNVRLWENQHERRR